jgi:hypothetical protein
MMGNRAWWWVMAAGSAALGFAAGCSSNDDPSMFPPGGDRAEGFGAINGSRSDAPLGRKLEDDDDFDYEFREHLAKQDPRWRDREFRGGERARIRMEVQREEDANRRAAARGGERDGL